MPLTYLFRAYFADGSTFDQTPEDVAVLEHPRKGQGSAFTDLLWLVEHEGKEVAAFALWRAEDSQALAAVHLATGHFELGGHEFWAGTEGLDAGVERRLIYYRSVTQTASMDVDAASGDALGAWRYETHVTYYFGWQATVDGRNVQHVIGLDG